MKKLFPLLLLILMLTGCAQPAAPTEDTTPTPPSIPTQQTPYELLSATLDKTLAADTLTLEITESGETLHHTDSPDRLLPHVRQWIPNEVFLQAFCALPLHAIPSNTGVIRYELSNLTAADLSALLGREITAEGECAIALEVNESGCFSGFSCVFGDNSLSVRIINPADGKSGAIAST